MPNGLTIIEKAASKPTLRFGIMTHVKVSKRFVYESNELRKRIHGRFGFRPPLMVDSGAFIKNHTPFSESDLFACYNRMGASYGIVNDVLGDAPGTIANCSKAMREYLKSRRSFKLVGVAQGQSLDEYLSCYYELAKIGYRYVAVGGLLQKKPRSIRFTQVRDKQFMQQVLRGIRNEFNPDWLYALGIYHPQRHKLFRELSIWGSDYKGWLFRYPSIFQGFITLSKVASESSLTAREIRKIKQTHGLIKKYRYCDDVTRVNIKTRVHVLHAELWRSQSMSRMLRQKNLPIKEHRLLQAVFWHSTTKRREEGILHHLSKEVFPTLRVPKESVKRNASFDY